MINSISQESKILQKYITDLLTQSTIAYQNTKIERKKITSLFSVSEDEFTVLEEIELLTVIIRGYASQIQARGWIENKQAAIEQLQHRRFLNNSAIAQFYLNANEEYKQTKAYIQTLDYLRLSILEYLFLNSTSL